MLKIGKLYIWNEPGVRWNEPDKKTLVFLVSAEKVKPIYTKYKFLVLNTNESRQEILDKFKLVEFEKSFTEVTDESQIKKIQKEVEKK